MAKAKKLTAEEIAELSLERDRDLFLKIEQFFMDKFATPEYTQEIRDASETWESATNNGADSCRDNGKTVWENTIVPSHEMVSHTFGTLMGLIDEDYPGKDIFKSLGFNF